MDATGTGAPGPDQPGHAPDLAGDATPVPPIAGAATRRSAAAWLWSRRMPVRTAARSRRSKITVGLLALALAGGGGVAFAAANDTSSPSPSETSKPDVPGKPGDPGKGDVVKRVAPWAGKLGLGRGGMVHGEFTVPDGDDGYRTMITQNGTVADLSGNRLTVKSADGWSKEYTLDTSTLIAGQRFWSPDSSGDLTEGQDVMVTATVKDGTAHADQVRTQLDKADLEKRAGELKQRMGGDFRMERGGRVFEFRGGPGGMKGMPGMPEMGGRTEVKPAPGDSATAPAPDVASGMFTVPMDGGFMGGGFTDGGFATGEADVFAS